jgi:hypothetical protein
VAKIIDDDEWRKVTEGVYTGFSIGGGYARRWPDKENPGLMRYTPVLSEVSLVDNPAVSTATFQLIKHDGSIELRKFNAADTASADTFAGASRSTQLLAGLTWLAGHAEAIGAAGLLAHIMALTAYLQEEDAGDQLSVQPAEKLHKQIGELQKRITLLEAQPLPAKGVLRAVGKYDDRMRADEMPEGLPADRARELMKAALANPQFL